MAWLLGRLQLPADGIQTSPHFGFGEWHFHKHGEKHKQNDLSHSVRDWCLCPWPSQSLPLALAEPPVPPDCQAAMLVAWKYSRGVVECSGSALGCPAGLSALEVPGAAQFVCDYQTRPQACLGGRALSEDQFLKTLGTCSPTSASHVAA